LTNIEVDKH